MKVISIGGKNRPVHFGVNALAEFNQATGTNFEWIFRIAENPMLLDFNQLRWLVYVGLKQGATEHGQQVDFTLDDVGNWLNEDFGKFPEFVKEMSDTLPKMDEGEKKSTPENR